MKLRGRKKASNGNVHYNPRSTHTGRAFYVQIVNNAPSWSRNELTTTQHQHIRQTELSATLNITRIFMNETDSAAVRARDFGSVFYVRIAGERTARSSLAPNFSPRATGSMFAKKHMFWCTLLRRVVSFFFVCAESASLCFPPMQKNEEFVGKSETSGEGHHRANKRDDYL